MRWLFLMLFCWQSLLFADNMNNYMHIANQIPKMEIKADAQAQAWARSARTVLLVTNESIAETITAANERATAAGHPLYCLPAGTILSARMLQGMIEQYWREAEQQQKLPGRTTVSEIAMQAVLKKYACKSQSGQVKQLRQSVSSMAHAEASG